jgi:hypothetical protein
VCRWQAGMAMRRNTQMAMYTNGFILLLYCLAKIELFIETARRGEIKKRFDVLSKTPKRFTSNVETFF